MQSIECAVAAEELGADGPISGSIISRAGRSGKVLLKSLADEQAKEPPPKIAFSSRVDLHQGTTDYKALNTLPHIRSLACD